MKKERKITTIFYEELYADLPNEDKEIINSARDTLKDAYAPYSGFLVGACIKLENGEKISANNQENVAYPSGLCAERVGIYYAGSKFPGVKIKTIAIAAISKKTSLDDVISPCGSCRQVIAEYEEKQDHHIRLLLYHQNDTVLVVNSIKDLLPFMFRNKSLKNY